MRKKVFAINGYDVLADEYQYIIKKDDEYRYFSNLPQALFYVRAQDIKNTPQNLENIAIITKRYDDEFWEKLNMLLTQRGLYQNARKFL